MKRLVLTVVASVFFGYACGGSESPPSPQGPVDRPLWNTAWDISNETQRAALADGVLTFDEYEAAALAAVACVNAHGMEGEAVFDAASSTYSVGARWQGVRGTPDDDQKKRDSDECFATYWEGINQAWAAFHQPEEALLASARAALIACLERLGSEVPESTGPGEIQLLHGDPHFGTCLREVQRDFGLPPQFGG